MFKAMDIVLIGVTGLFSTGSIENILLVLVTTIGLNVAVQSYNGCGSFSISNIGRFWSDIGRSDCDRNKWCWGWFIVLNRVIWLVSLLLVWVTVISPGYDQEDGKTDLK